MCTATPWLSVSCLWLPSTDRRDGIGAEGREGKRGLCRGAESQALQKTQAPPCDFRLRP